MTNIIGIPPRLSKTPSRIHRTNVILSTVSDFSRNVKLTNEQIQLLGLMIDEAIFHVMEYDKMSSVPSHEASNDSSCQ